MFSLLGLLFRYRLCRLAPVDIEHVTGAATVGRHPKVLLHKRAFAAEPRAGHAACLSDSTRRSPSLRFKARRIPFTSAVNPVEAWRLELMPEIGNFLVCLTREIYVGLDGRLTDSCSSHMTCINRMYRRAYIIVSTAALPKPEHALLRTRASSRRTRHRIWETPSTRLSAIMSFCEGVHWNLKLRPINTKIRTG